MPAITRMEVVKPKWTDAKLGQCLQISQMQPIGKQEIKANQEGPKAEQGPSREGRRDNQGQNLCRRQNSPETRAGLLVPLKNYMTHTLLRCGLSISPKPQLYASVFTVY